MGYVKFKRSLALYEPVESRDSEGGRINTYPGPSRTVYVNLQPRTYKLHEMPIGSVQTATLVGYADNGTDVRIRDGAAVEGSAIDYVVSSVQKYRTHMTFELTKVVL